MTPSPAPQHRKQAPTSLSLAVITVSDTRTLETDGSGAWIVELAQAAGHRVLEREIVADDPVRIQELLTAYRDRDEIQAALLTGGTGVSPRDRTPEAVEAVLTLRLPGFGELFRMMSYEEIGTASLMSRALGGVAGRLVILAMPGSKAAVQLAMTRIVLPELPHLVFEARK